MFRDFCLQLGSHSAASARAGLASALMATPACPLDHATMLGKVLLDPGPMTQFYMKSGNCEWMLATLQEWGANVEEPIPDLMSIRLEEHALQHHEQSFQTPVSRPQLT